MAVWTAYSAAIVERPGDAPLPTVHAFIGDAADWFMMWPLYTLPPLGRWATEKTLPPRDAAHAMPPQGETIELSLDNRVLSACHLHGVAQPKGRIKDGFEAYERARRPAHQM